VTLSSHLAVDHEVRVQEVLLVVAHWLARLAVVRAACGLQHLAARALHNGLSRAGVPLRSGSEAGVHVGGALGHHEQLEAAAALDALGALVLGDEGVGFRAVVGGRSHHREVRVCFREFLRKEGRKERRKMMNSGWKITAENMERKKEVNELNSSQ